jgi:hypothetical protein
MSLTREEKNAIQRERRRLSGDAHTKKYEKTFKGKLMRTYRNMESRCKGIVKGKAHLYEGLEVLPREDFYQWSLSDEGYKMLFEVWVESGYDKKLSPSIDRKDTGKGYTLGNIRWVTHSENSRAGAINRNEHVK